MRAVVTVGLGFGDEGKGATVDFLTRALNADLVVRYCGGAQAGHNVQLPGGRRHTFAQFGAGTLAGARTFLGSRVIINPAAMQPEAEHLRQLGIADPFATLSVHPDCLVSTAYHVAMNRLREAARGDRRHGSCGLGIGEARSYWLRHGQDAVFAGDLRDRRTLRAKLALLRDRLLQDMQSLARLDRRWQGMLHDTRPGEEADELMRDAADVAVSPTLPDCHTAVFEGAQGVLLDEWKGLHPYTTWSTVTPQHAWEIIDEHGFEDVTVLGVTRAYTTRHGAGPFPTFCPHMTAEVVDRGNPANAWQGAIRSGPLDLVLLEYAARVCRIDGLVVNCLDQLSPQVRLCERYGDLVRIEEPRSLKAQAELTSRLESAVPVYRTTTPDALLARLAEVAPLALIAAGPIYVDRSFTSAPFSHHSRCRRADLGVATCARAAGTLAATGRSPPPSAIRLTPRPESP